MFWTLAQTDAPAEAEAPTTEDKLAAAQEEASNAFADALNGDPDAAMQLFVDYGLPVVWALAIIIITFIVAKILGGMLARSCRKANLDETLARFFGKLVFYLVLIIGVMFALSKFGIEVTSFAAILAAAGFAVGMAMSGTLSNFACGVMLLIFRPFKVGDVVSAAGVTAKVHEIELFTTTMDTPDNRRIIVPNSSIYGGVIENITFHPERRVDVAVGTDYSASLDETRKVLEKACDSLSDKLLTGEGRGYQIYLVELGDSSIAWAVRFWAKTEDYWGVREDLTRAVKVHLDEAGIGIPFPQMDVHLDKPE